MSFLTNKYGPLPAWGWGAAVGGLVLLAKLSKGGGGARPPGPPPPFGGPDMGTEPSNKGIGASVTAFGYGNLDSKINASFFGNGVVEMSSEELADVYTDIFPVGMGIRSQTRVPTGAGGIGTHGPRWAGESAPAGGEGFQNYGQGTGPRRPANRRPIGLNFHEHHHGGGSPHPQKTTMGSPLNTYMSQHGDTFDNVANKMWGPGQNGTLIHQANPGLAGDPHSSIAPGHMLNIPSAPPIGLAPSGVAGNGVGPGSWQPSTRSRQQGRGMHHQFGVAGAGHGDDDDLSTASAMGERPKPGRGGHGKRHGRGIQK